MTAYRCPLHGCEFDREHLPDFVKNCFCPTCSQDLSAAIAQAQVAYDACHRSWLDWMRHSGVPARGRNRTIENWQPQSRPQQIAAKLVRNYAADIAGNAQRGTGLTLLGPPGVGKTHLGCGLVACAYLAGLSARYVVWADVVDRTKASFATRESEDRRLIDDLKRTPLLVLDEIGVRVGSEFDQALLFDLIDTRYRNQRATVIATNLTADTLDSIGERTADRLREANLSVPVPGESRRSAAAVDQDLIHAPPALMEPSLPMETIRVCINGELIDRRICVQPKESRW